VLKSNEPAQVTLTATDATGLPGVSFALCAASTTRVHCHRRCGRRQAKILRSEEQNRTGHAQDFHS